MTTAITYSGLTTALAACADAIGTGDWAAARRYLAQARVIFLGLPNDVAGADKRYSYRAEMDDAAKLIDAAEAATKKGTDEGRRIIKTRVGYAGS